MKKRGFTLIELLAVIVILAIIALIAVPTIMNIITKARKSAFKDSAYGIIKAGELYYAENLLDGGITEEKTFNFPNDIAGLSINGSLPESGSMKVNTEGKVALAISNGKYCVRKGYADVDVKVDEDITNCSLLEEEVIEENINPNTSVANIKTIIEVENRYEVSSLEELNYIAKLVNEGNSLEGKTVVLVTDIDLGNNDYIPIGISSSTSFKGTFDGNNYSISNLKINSSYDYSSLFGYVGKTGIVKNIIINGLVINGSKYVGGLVSYNLGKIDNFSIENGSISGNSYVGGIAGYNEGTIINGKVENCSISGSNYVGELIGDGTAIDDFNYGSNNNVEIK